MYLCKGSIIRLWGAAALGLGLCVLPAGQLTQAQVVQLVLTVPDTSVVGGEVGAYLAIRISNYFDTIAGFQFVLVSEKPELVKFDFSQGGFDTTGTLVSGFEYAQGIDRAGDQSEVWFRCIANLPFDTVHNWGFPMQQGGVAVKIPLTTAAVEDSTLTSAVTVTSPTDFSDPWGNSIGVVTETIYDTTYYLCTLWQHDTCREWLQVEPDSAGYDSMHIETWLYGYLDSSQVIINAGSVTVRPAPLECDYDGDGRITIADLTTLVDCLFRFPFPQPAICEKGCDADGSGSTNVADLTYLVDYLFCGGPPPG